MRHHYWVHDVGEWHACAVVTTALTCPRADATMSRKVPEIFATSFSRLFSASTSAHRTPAVHAISAESMQALQGGL